MAETYAAFLASKRRAWAGQAIPLISMPDRLFDWRPLWKRLCVERSAGVTLMTYDTFLTAVIDQGIAGATADYAATDAEKLRGSLDGFDLCRGQSPVNLRDLLTAVEQDARRRLVDRAADYWYWRARACEVEWVCNCVSAILMNDGIEPIAPWLPTVRGVLQADRILRQADAPVEGTCTT